MLNSRFVLKFSSVFSPIFRKLLFMSVGASMAALSMILLRFLADKKIPPLCKYFMWLPVIAAFIIPFRPQSNISAMKQVQKIENISYVRQFDDIKEQYHQIESEEKDLSEEMRSVAQLQREWDSVSVKLLIFDFLMPFIWLIGMIAAAFCFILSAVRVYIAFKINTDCGRLRCENIMQECKNILHLSKLPKLTISENIATPSVTGIFYPLIILPQYVLSFSDTGLKFIILHEMSHYKRKDTFLNAVVLFVLAVHWFNPVVWVMTKYIRQDMELANDEYLLKKLGDDNGAQYAKVLVAVLAQSRNIKFLPGVMCAANDKYTMKRRITMINLSGYFKKHRQIISAVCLMFTMAISCAFLTSCVDDGANGSVSKVNLHFPAYIVENPNGIMYIERLNSANFDVKMELPKGWQVKMEYDGISLPTGELYTPLYLYNGDEPVGYIGFNIFEPYQDEIPQEDYYKTVWATLRLSSVSVWDPFTSVKADGTMESGTVNISYLDPDEIKNHSGAMADVPMIETNGILAYDKNIQAFVGIAFLPDTVDEATAAAIAQSIEFTVNN